MPAPLILSDRAADEAVVFTKRDRKAARGSYRQKLAELVICQSRAADEAVVFIKRDRKAARGSYRQKLAKLTRKPIARARCLYADITH